MFEMLKTLVTPDMIGRLVRSGIQMGGVWLASHYSITDFDPAALAGAFGAAAATVWTWFVSKKTADAVVASNSAAAAKAAGV